MRILIAEDEPTSRKLLAAVLQKGGHEVVVTSNGAEAWEAARKPGAPKLLILDWMMPEMDGFEVCRRIRALPTDEPPYIMLLTALDDEEHLVSGLSEGADDYVAKPFRTRELLARVEVAGRIVGLQSRLAQEASVDSLTGVANRVAILRTLERELACAQRTHAEVGVAILDIDFFKKVNDTLGHAGGDEVLREFALRCAQALRMRDALGRYGGEEFLIVAPGCHVLDPLWERIRASIAATPFFVGTELRPVTVSIGVSSGIWSATPQDLIEAADKALYRAKRGGRNRVEHEPLGESSGAPAPAKGTGGALTEEGPAKGKAGSRPHALIAEDERVSRSILEGMLRKLGFETEIAEDGEYILGAMQRFAGATAVFLCWRLLDMDGVELCRRIRASGSQPPPYIVMLPSSRQTQNLTGALDAGANDFIVKPYQLDDLRARAGVAFRVLELQNQLSEKEQELRRATEKAGGAPGAR